MVFLSGEKLVTNQTGRESEIVEQKVLPVVKVAEHP